MSNREPVRISIYRDQVAYLIVLLRAAQSKRLATNDQMVDDIVDRLRTYDVYPPGKVPPLQVL